MSKLLKADFFRVLKSKLTYIIVGIAVLMPLLTCLLYLGINNLIGLIDESGELISFVNGRILIFSSYSMTNNIGIVIPIFASIFICMDINNGTLRNKIISGSPRIKVYLSHLFTTIIFNVIIISIYLAFTTLFSNLFFGYGVEIDKEEIRNIILFIVSGTLSFVFIASVISFLALVTKNTAPTIIFTLLFTIGLSLILSIVSILDTEKYATLLFMIPTYMHYVLTNGFEVLTTAQVIEGVASYLIFTVALAIAGIEIFKHKDIK